MSYFYACVTLKSYQCIHQGIPWVKNLAYPTINIPVVFTISNNMPGSDIFLGVDTTVKEITEVSFTEKRLY